MQMNSKRWRGPQFDERETRQQTTKILCQNILETKIQRRIHGQYKFKHAGKFDQTIPAVRYYLFTKAFTSRLQLPAFLVTNSRYESRSHDVRGLFDDHDMIAMWP